VQLLIKLLCAILAS